MNRWQFLLNQSKEMVGILLLKMKEQELIEFVVNL